MGCVMYNSIVTADSRAHAKMLAVALVAATLFVWIGLAARMAGG